jgi:hypothetical protein
MPSIPTLRNGSVAGRRRDAQRLVDFEVAFAGRSELGPEQYEPHGWGDDQATSHAQVQRRPTRTARSRWTAFIPGGKMVNGKLRRGTWWPNIAQAVSSWDRTPMLHLPLQDRIAQVWTWMVATLRILRPVPDH